MPEVGHSGFVRTYLRVSRSFFWKGLKRDVKKFMTACDVCQHHKYSTMSPN